MLFSTFLLGNLLRAKTLCSFSDASTSKSALRIVFFVHFDFEMCFVPQRRTLFRHLNFQKRSEHEVLCTLWLGNVLHATTVCNFSSLIRPDGSAPAGFASLLFDPPEPQITGKHCASWLFYLFALHLLSSDSFSSLIFFLLLFSSPTLPTSAFPSLYTLSEIWVLNFLWWLANAPTCDTMPEESHPFCQIPTGRLMPSKLMLLRWFSNTAFGKHVLLHPARLQMQEDRGILETMRIREIVETCFKDPTGYFLLISHSNCHGCLCLQGVWMQLLPLA